MPLASDVVGMWARVLYAVLCRIGVRPTHGNAAWEIDSWRAILGPDLSSEESD